MLVSKASSSSQPHYSVCQRQQAQHRQILAMMGVTAWVDRQAITCSIEDILTFDNGVDDTQQHLEHSTVFDTFGIEHERNSLSNNNKNNNDNKTDQQAPVSLSQIHQQDRPQSIDINDDIDTIMAMGDDIPDVPMALMTFGEDDGYYHTDENEYYYSHNKQQSNSEQYQSTVEVSPFTLQGMAYRGWVLLVDIAVLDKSTQSLWQNIAQALSMPIEQMAFPLCENMSTLDMANASVAGFVFKLAQQECQQILALTPLPEGLQIQDISYGNEVDNDVKAIDDINHQQQSILTLEDMIVNPEKKRQLWRLLS